MREQYVRATIGFMKTLMQFTADELTVNSWDEHACTHP